MTYERLQEAAEAIKQKSGRPDHVAAVVLGSGLSDYATSLDGAVEIPYLDIPNFPVPNVEGHSGSLFSVELDGAAVLVFAGRVHTYEGWDLSDVVFGVRTAVAAGCRAVLLTNAAGGSKELGVIEFSEDTATPQITFTGADLLPGYTPGGQVVPSRV